MPLFRQAPLGGGVGRPKHEALREEMHRFVDLKISESASTASAEIALQPCVCCPAEDLREMIETSVTSQCKSRVNPQRKSKGRLPATC